MTRLLIIVACLFLSINCFANDYILVSGEGRTIEQAKESAFRQAIQIKVGTIVLSEREAIMDKLNRDDISVYSAGYVTDYKTLSVNESGNRVVVVLNVLVKESKLLNQTLSTGKTIKEIDGDKSFVGYDTYLKQKDQADKLLSALMTTYPKNAYILTQGTHRILVDSYRNGIIEIPYVLKWNFDFIRTFNEIVVLVQDNNYGWLDVAPSNIKLGHRTHYKFNDAIMLDNIKSKFLYENYMHIWLDIKDNSGNVLYQMCYNSSKPPGSFFSSGDPTEFRIYDFMKDEGVIRVMIAPEYRDVIQRASRIELSVSSDRECQKIKH